MEDTTGEGEGDESLAAAISIVLSRSASLCDRHPPHSANSVVLFPESCENVVHGACVFLRTSELSKFTEHRRSALRVFIECLSVALLYRR